MSKNQAFYAFCLAMSGLFILACITIQLSRIAHQARVANCLTLARAGHICTDLARKQ